jgi:cell division protein FtsW
MLFALIGYRGYRIASEAPDRFGMLLAVGVSTWVIFQALFNIGGVTSAIPFTGITLPFVSYGGSSLVVSLAAMGIVLNVSRQTVRLPSRRAALVQSTHAPSTASVMAGARLDRIADPIVPVDSYLNPADTEEAGRLRREAPRW